MKTTIERELKFEGDDIQIDRLGGEPIEPHVFASSYHDTADRRLLRAGITLRRRVENGVSKWQLKLPSSETRLELEEPGGPASPPSALARLLSGILRGSELELIAMLETHRRGRLVDGVEVTIDDVSVLEGMAVVGRFSEIEAELVNGSRRSIEHIGKALRELGATPSTETTKIMRVVEVPSAPRVDPKDPALEHLRAFIRAQLDELRANDPIVRAAEDADAVHDMRVAVRRLRAVLRTARPMLDRAWSNDLRHELDLLGRLLGAVRDLDVLIERLTHEATEIGADAGDDRAARRAVAVAARRGADAAPGGDGRPALLLPPRPPRGRNQVSPGDTNRSHGRTARAKGVREPPCLRKAHLTRRRRQLHKLRIHSKRARYAAELARTSRGAPAARFIKAATRLQDVLGEHQDAVVTLGELRRLARIVDSRSVAFTAGRLTEHEEQRKLEARHDLPKIWKSVEQRGKAAW